ncbi:MAG: hypothetical protein H6742_21155 [Alphaproteobacteria bacterium]|nr:hypothetical protein [Alphaproteobacteria bacterium]
MLVLGFGPFGEVRDNPARRVALAVDGVVEEGLVVFGEEMPVSYDRAPALALARAHELDARLIVGVGVAVTRSRVEVECVGRNRLSPARPDVDGVALALCSTDGPAQVAATAAVERLAAGLQAACSQDAGDYVCNAWLYRVARAAPSDRAVVFVHVPAEGMAPARLLAGLRALRDGGPTSEGRLA